MYTDQNVVENKFIMWDEDYFHEILSLEKKRTDRSGKPLLLMLLNIKSIYQGSRSNYVVSSDLSFLSAATRETDIKGWYEYGSIVGVIFTEIGEVDISFAKAKIVKNLTQGLKCITGLDQINDKAISFKVFPEVKHKTGKLKAPINLKTLPADSVKRNVPAALSHVFSKILGQRCLLLLGDMFLILLALLLSNGALFGHTSHTVEDFNHGFWLAFLLYPTALYIFDLYEVGRRFQSMQSLLRLALAGILVAVSFTIFSVIIPELHFNRGLLSIQMILVFVLLSGWRFLYGAFSPAAKAKVGTLIVGTGASGMAVYRLLKNCTSPYEVKGFIDDDPALLGKVMGSPAVVGTSDSLMEVAEQMGIRSAILAVDGTHTPRFVRTILEARLGGLEIMELPTLYERFAGRVPVQLVGDQWLLFSDGFDLLSREYIQKLKRILDFTVSALLLLSCAPLMAFTALAIWAESPGPVFYRQDRVGRGGKVFRVFKFRSMRLNAETEGAQWAQKHDARITRVGRWIRIFRIDELPQILNIFLGDMSLVGPRPERPEFVTELEAAIPYYSARHSVRPGLTGWAQVNYPYGASIEDSLRKLEYDLYYVKNMSILLDLQILLKTVGVVLLGEGAR